MAEREKKNMGGASASRAELRRNLPRVSGALDSIGARFKKTGLAGGGDILAGPKMVGSAIKKRITTPAENLIPGAGMAASNREYERTMGPRGSATLAGQQDQVAAGTIPAVPSDSLYNRSSRAAESAVSRKVATPTTGNFEDFAAARQGVGVNGQPTLTGPRISQGQVNGQPQRVLHNMGVNPTTMPTDGNTVNGVPMDQAMGRVNQNRVNGTLRDGSRYTYFDEADAQAQRAGRSPAGQAPAGAAPQGLDRLNGRTVSIGNTHSALANFFTGVREQRFAEKEKDRQLTMRQAQMTADTARYNADRGYQGDLAKAKNSDTKNYTSDVMKFFETEGVDEWGNTVKSSDNAGLIEFNTLRTLVPDGDERTLAGAVHESRRYAANSGVKIPAQALGELFKDPSAEAVAEFQATFGFIPSIFSRGY